MYARRFVAFVVAHERRQCRAVRREWKRSLSTSTGILADVATADYVLSRAVGELDLVVTPYGGDLRSAVPLSVYAMAPQCRVVGLEPERG